MDNNILVRVEALERQLRRWKTVTMLLLAILVMVMLTGAAYPSGDEGLLQMPSTRVLSHSFVLVGKDGKTYARLIAKQGRPVLEFYDGHGEVTWSAPPEVTMKPAQ